tara:strand:+ start:801 stop:1565 length:765 start_codon:yes stop_codon:yes gene_type:complete
MQVNYFKYQSSGNNFVLIDNIKQKTDFKPIMTKLIDSQHVKESDGVLIINRSDKYDFNLNFYNPDGTSSFCGNGSLCSLHYLYNKNFLNDSSHFISYGINCLAKIGSEIKLKMIDIKSVIKIYDGYFVNSGAPHFIKFLDYDINKIDMQKEVTKIKSYDFYLKTPFNINFVQRKKDHILIRTFEKGVERETLSCGTGAVAAIVASSQIYEDRFNLIKAKGGDLNVNYERRDELFQNIYLSASPIMEECGIINII